MAKPANHDPSANMASPEPELEPVVDPYTDAEPESELDPEYSSPDPDTPPGVVVAAVIGVE